MKGVQHPIPLLTKSFVGDYGAYCWKFQLSDRGVGERSRLVRDEGQNEKRRLASSEGLLVEAPANEERGMELVNEICLDEQRSDRRELVAFRIFMLQDRLPQLYVSGAVLEAMDEDVPGGHGPEESQASSLRSLFFDFQRFSCQNKQAKPFLLHLALSCLKIEH